MLKYQVKIDHNNNNGVGGGGAPRIKNRRRKSAAVVLNRNFDASGGDNGDSESCSSAASDGATLNSFHRHRSTSISSLSSGSSSSDTAVEWGTIRVYTSTLRTDSDYKTLFISTAHTAEDLIQNVQAKVRSAGNCSSVPPKIRDMNLFYLAMELETVHEGSVVRNLIALDSKSRPLELQACHPRDRARFILQTRKGVMIRVYENALHPEFKYKCLMVSTQTSCSQVIAMLLQAHHLPHPVNSYEIVVVDIASKDEFALDPDELVASVQEQICQHRPNYQLHIKPVAVAKLFRDVNRSSCEHTNVEPSTILSFDRLSCASA